MKKIIVSVIALVVALGGGAFAFRYYMDRQAPAPIVLPESKPVIQEGTVRPEPKPAPLPIGNGTPSNRPAPPVTPETAPVQVVAKKTLDDTVSTLANPVKVPTADGKEYFIIGQPKGQNAKRPRKIVFSLPGHGSTAEEDYAAWKSHVVDRDYALASLNWWHGGGEKMTDYYRPDEVLREIRAFLDMYGYTAQDFVVLEGFSRGSANTYAVKAYDMASGTPIIDAVISASGKYQSDFPLSPEQSAQTGKLFRNVPWVLACGEKDENPERDGCIGMNETKTYLTDMGANVAKVLSDPKGGHGAFHQSPLKLAGQALDLLSLLPAAQPL